MTQEELLVSESIDDLERAVEELIVGQHIRCGDAGREPGLCRECAARAERAAQARELVRRLRAGIAECERVLKHLDEVADILEEDELASRRRFADRVLGLLRGVANLGSLTGATGESEKGDE